MKSVLFVAAALLVAMTSFAEPPASVSFRRDISPLFAKECAQCHMKEGPAAGLVLETTFCLRNDSWCALNRKPT